MSEATAPDRADPVSPVAGGRRLLTGREKIIIGVVVFAACGVVTLWPSSKAPPPRERDQPIETATRSQPYRPMPEPPRPVAALPAIPAPAAATPLSLPLPGAGRSRPLVNPTPIMSYEAATPATTATAPQSAQAEGLHARAPAPPALPKRDDSLSARLRPSGLTAVRASVMRNPELTVPMGTRIACLPEMPIDSTVAGFFSCITPVDVRGATGTVILMERGTRIVGEVRSGMARGAQRLFVVMTHALTPGGVEIELASPGADVMGQAGLDGEVDSHFFERFRGAMLLAFLDTGLQAAAVVASNALNNGNGVTFNQFQTTGQRTAGEAMQSDINIPPTLRRNQAEPMTVFVARNLDFSDVYRLVSQ